MCMDWSEQESTTGMYCNTPKPSSTIDPHQGREEEVGNDACPSLQTFLCTLNPHTLRETLKNRALKHNSSISCPHAIMQKLPHTECRDRSLFHFTALMLTNHPNHLNVNKPLALSDSHSVLRFTNQQHPVLPKSSTAKKKRGPAKRKFGTRLKAGR